MVIATAMGINDSIPREDGYYSQYYGELSEKTNAITYLSLFLPPDDIEYLKKNAKLPKNYAQHTVTESINEKASVDFLKLFDKKFTSDGFKEEEKKSEIHLRWKKIYDGADSKNLSQSKKDAYDTNQLFWSLYNDFSVGMIECVNLLQKNYSNKNPVYDEVRFDRVLRDAGIPSVWIRKTTNSSFKDLEDRLSTTNANNVLRKAQSYIEFAVAGAALAYFILVMFYFIFVKIERNLRIISDCQSSQTENIDIKSNSAT